MKMRVRVDREKGRTNEQKRVGKRMRKEAKDVMIDEIAAKRRAHV